jgi:hypothetical protein
LLDQPPIERDMLDVPAFSAPSTIEKLNPLCSRISRTLGSGDQLKKNQCKTVVIKVFNLIGPPRELVLDGLTCPKRAAVAAQVRIKSGRTLRCPGERPRAGFTATVWPLASDPEKDQT